MPLLEPKPVFPGHEIEGAAEDCKQSKRAGQYRAGEKAVYFPGWPATQYIPYATLTSLEVRNSSMPTTGCCGKELPVVKMIFRWDGGDHILVVDPPKCADTILEQVRSIRPELPVDDRRAK